MARQARSGCRCERDTKRTRYLIYLYYTEHTMTKQNKYRTWLVSYGARVHLQVSSSLQRLAARSPGLTSKGALEQRPWIGLLRCFYCM
jgi:hypothetical protein